jgi:DNA-directed RNA polymerase subunit RPC12/RpoP
VPTARSELNEQEVREFHAWMLQNNIPLRCPICRHTSFIKHERVSVSTLDDRTPLQKTGSKAVQIECEHCGYKLRFGGEVAQPFFWPATES